ncbi:MAG: cyclic nucleotide-binding domain-containing protein [Polyangiales bacterium]
MDSRKSGDTGADPAAAIDDEARWALTTARALQSGGDIAGAVSWYRRAVDHLMESGNDEAALEVARMAAGLSSPPPPARVTTSSSAAAQSSKPAATQSAPPAAAVASSPPAAVAQPGPPQRVITRPSQVPTTIALVQGGGERVSPEPLDASMSGEVSAQESMDLLRALRAAVSFQPARGGQAEPLAARLAGIPLFAELPPETVRAVARQVTLVEFEPGELLLTPGHAGPEPPLYVLLEGRGLLRATGDEGPGTPLGAGDFIGEIPALYGGRCVMSASARELITAAALPRALVSWLAREFPSVRVVLEDAAWERAFGSLGRASPFLRRLSPDQRGVAYARFEPVLLNPGDLLLGEGAPPLAFWLIAAGEVEVYGGGISGRLPLRAHAGDAIGLRAILDAEPSGVSARTLGPVLAAKAGISTFRALAERYAALAEAADDVGIPGRAIVC